MSTPTKPERVEVGSRWECGGSRSTVTRLEDANGTRKVWLRYDGTTHEVFSPEALFVGARPSYGYLAPATPGTATVAPAATCDCDGADNRHWGECPLNVGWRCSTCHGVHGEPPCPPGWHSASKPPVSPRPQIPASCQLERWDESGPLTALQAIQAKREPEPWVPSCDIDCDIPDADEGWRR